MHTASIHSDPGGDDAGWVPVESGKRSALETVLRVVDPLEILNKVGRMIQHSVSEQSSDCLEDKCCVNTVHSTAAQAAPTTGSMLSNFAIFIIICIGPSVQSSVS